MADPLVTTEVRGIVELQAALPRFGDKVMDGAAAAARIAAEHAADLTRARVPRKTGRLAGSVQVANRKGKRQRALIGRGIPPYAGWIEFGGTRGRDFVPGGRYLWPAAQDNESLFQHEGESETRKAIRKMRWPKPRR